MSTQADSAQALRKSLDPSPSGQARMNRFPEGWSVWQSQPDPRYGTPGRWYATAPYNVGRLNAGRPRGERGLEATVSAESERLLVVAVKAQQRLFEALSGAGAGNDR